MKVLLISANTLNDPYPVYPLGIDYVAASVAKKHHVQIADMNEMKNYDALLKVIYEYIPDIIGISLRNIDNSDSTDPQGFIENYTELVSVLKKNYKAPIVLGGSGFTIFPLQIMRVLNADYGVLGEGERLIDLLDAIENKLDIHKIQGIMTKDSKEDIPPPLSEPFAEGITDKMPIHDFYLKNGGMLNLQTKRGCVFRCVYCTYPHIEGGRLRLLEPETIANEAIKLQDFGAKYFFITDSAFNVDYTHSLKVARAFIKAGVSIPWGAFFSPTRPPEDYYRILSDSGLTHVEFGTDTLSKNTLTRYQKPFQVEHAVLAHKKAINVGLNVSHYFLLGGPGETHASIDETFSNIDKLDQSVLFFFCGMRIYPHTPLYRIAIKEGQIHKTQRLLNPVFYKPNGITQKEIIRIVEKRGNGRSNWIIGSGGKKISKIISLMHSRGYFGPLWERLIR